MDSDNDPIPIGASPVESRALLGSVDVVLGSSENVRAPRAAQ